MNRKLTARDNDIVDVLTNRVRVLSVAQIAAFWWKGSRDAYRAAHRRIQELAGEKLLHSFTTICHPMVELKEPVIRWKPGCPEPPFPSAAYKLQSRWNQPPVSTKCVIATARAGVGRGGYGGRRPRSTEQAHDLHLSAVYLDLRISDPVAASLWKSEAELQRERNPGSNDRLPDALVNYPGAPLIMEFGGAYSKEKLAEFHAWCAASGYPYEVW